MPPPQEGYLIYVHEVGYASSAGGELVLHPVSSPTSLTKGMQNNCFNDITCCKMIIRSLTNFIADALLLVLYRGQNGKQTVNLKNSA